MVNKGTNTNSKRIASNTMVLFVRMFIMTIINLYAVRFVLNGLGKDGYGIFTSVTSVVAVASVLNVVLALSIQRFYSFYLGKKDAKVLNEIFSSSIYRCISVSMRHCHSGNCRSMANLHTVDNTSGADRCHLVGVSVLYPYPYPVYPADSLHGSCFCP